MRGNRRWKLAALSGAIAVAAVAGTASIVHSADHRDAPQTTNDPASDINDVFAFVDGNNFVLAMTVFPFASSTAKFSDATQYVFHTGSSDGFGKINKSVDVLCTFDTAQKISCWVNTTGTTAQTIDYVTGDASAEAGLSSASGKVKVFAGLRGDPFFFNLQGFKDAVGIVEQVAASPTPPTFDGSGCPQLNTAQSTLLVNTLKETTSTNNPNKTQADDFATANTLGLVVSLDKSLVTQGGPMVSVWASTNKGK